MWGGGGGEGGGCDRVVVGSAEVMIVPALCECRDRPGGAAVSALINMWQ